MNDQITKILIERDGQLWELYSYNPAHNEIAFIQGDKWVLIPMADFFAAFGKAVSGEVSNSKFRM
jgi:hypothetical protein